MTTAEHEARSCPHYPFAGVEKYDLGPLVEEFRESDGLERVEMPYGGQAYLAVRDADVRRVLTDPAFSRELGNAPTAPRLSDDQLPVGSLSAFDGPDHQRLRQLITATFTARNVRRYGDEVDRTVHRLIDEMVAGGQPAEAVAALCGALPTHMICEILGVPLEDRAGFGVMLKGLRAWRRPASEAGLSRNEIEKYFIGLIARRRDDLGDDLLSDLVRVQQEHQRLDDNELLNLAVALLGGGVGTPKVFFSGMVYLLLSHEDAWQRVVQDPDQAGPVMEELLRFVPVGTGGGKIRVAREDVLVGGTVVRAGEAVLPAMGAANRDPSVYDDPDSLRWDRGSMRHLAFGVGGHRCLGAEFARLQGRALIRGLAERLPTLHLADGEDSVVWLDGDVTRGPATIMVRW